MSIIFFDAESTGKADFRSSPDAPHQPRIVQLAALLTDDSAKELASLSCIIRPDGWTIPDEAAAIHGITTAIAFRDGIEEKAALHVFDQLLMRSSEAVAHNFDFDHHLLSRGSKIRKEELSFRRFCTMRAMTDICQIPSQYGYSEWKWPKLIEAYRFAFKEDFIGAHDAMADVRACARLYFWLKDRQKKEQEQHHAKSQLEKAAAQTQQTTNGPDVGPGQRTPDAETGHAGQAAGADCQSEPQP